jgi:DNA-binding HxlR family transcriptional regulator
MIQAEKFESGISAAVHIFGSKWKMMLILTLKRGTLRFSEIEENLPGITERILTKQLRELERDGLVARKVYAQVPSRVEYSLTDSGFKLRIVLEYIKTWFRIFKPDIFSPNTYFDDKKFVFTFGGKWKPSILWNLKEGELRFSEIKDRLKGISQRMLTKQLREMEKDGLIIRNAYDAIPPKVEYSLTEAGDNILPLLEILCKWAENHQKNYSGMN